MNVLVEAMKKVNRMDLAEQIHQVEMLGDKLSEDDKFAIINQGMCPHTVVKGLPLVEVCATNVLLNRDVKLVKTIWF